ncbi:glycosyltransferase 61 family protein [Yoonia sp. R2331]|uniref:glycosyltransferase 61 family protein n=1 Tax=Yoonia sp. R2331 TaxID=3237238 RepID=UPI0034E5A631
MHLRYFEPQEITHAPVLQYNLRDVLVLFNGVFARGGSFNRAKGLDHRALLTDPIHELDEAAYCLEDRSYFFFGHWLRSFAQCLLPAKDTQRIHFAATSWGHAGAYERIFDLPSLTNGQYHVARMALFQDFAQSPHKAERYKELRRRMFEHGAASVRDGKKVYLKRGATGAARLISNEDALEKALDVMGFDVIDLATTPIQEMIARCVGAEVALTIEGSHTDHLHWLIKPGGTLWVLNPSNHFNTSQFGVALSMGNRAACNIITEDGDAAYRVDLARLQDTYDLILK